MPNGYTTPEEMASKGFDDKKSVAETSLSRSDATVSNVAVAARQFAEVKGAIQLAREFPRSESDAFKAMRRTCSRTWFADNALYAFPRGTKPDGTPNIITGASIRLVEELVRAYRNIDYGFRIMEMRGDRSLIEAFAWDVENNIKARREFWVLHIRETKGGNFPITSPRDIYELCANMAQRRVRACVEEMLPVDLLEEAKVLCKKTMAQGGDGMPFLDRVRNMIVAFDEFGVSQDMIEEFLGHPVDAMIIEEMPKLKQAYNAIKERVAKREDFFNVPTVEVHRHRVPEPVQKGEAAPPPPPAATENAPGGGPATLNDDDRAALERANAKMREKQDAADAAKGPAPAEATPADVQSAIDAGTPVLNNRVDGQSPTVESGTESMSAEEMAEIEARELAEYEASKPKDDGDEPPPQKNSGGRSPRQARKPRGTR